MCAVYTQPCRAQYLSKERASLDFYLVNNVVFLVSSRVVRGTGNLLSNIDDQGASQCDIQDLMAATDREERFALAKYLVYEHQFEQIALAFGGVHRFGQGLRQSFPVEARINIVATRQ